MKMEEVVGKLRDTAIKQAQGDMDDKEEWAEKSMTEAQNIKTINDFLHWARDNAWDIESAFGYVFEELGIEVDEELYYGWDT